MKESPWRDSLLTMLLLTIIIVSLLVVIRNCIL